MYCHCGRVTSGSINGGQNATCRLPPEILFYSIHHTSYALTIINNNCLLCMNNIVLVFVSVLPLYTACCPSKPFKAWYTSVDDMNTRPSFSGGFDVININKKITDVFFFGAGRNHYPPPSTHDAHFPFFL